MEDQNKYQHISTKDIATVIAMSIAFDLVQGAIDFIPILGWILNIGIDFAAWITFYVWFKSKGVNFNEFKRFMFFNSGLILDFIPFVNMFAWTIDVILVISTLKIDNVKKQLDSRQ